MAFFGSTLHGLLLNAPSLFISLIIVKAFLKKNSNSSINSGREEAKHKMEKFDKSLVGLENKHEAILTLQTKIASIRIANVAARASIDLLNNSYIDENGLKDGIADA